ncbi:MAG: type II secretion system protein [Planctomycetes bacterium]|nr:type II secretion system protein [Planctomycetota bacterium]
MTLVEVLVVSAVLAILVAMLFPVLTASVERARRTACLNERRQLGISIFAFADEFSGRLPHPIPNWELGNRTMASQIYLQRDICMIVYGGTSQGVTALGSLAAFGYIEDPGLFFCPDFLRLKGEGSYIDGLGFNWNWDAQPEHSVWNKWMNDDDDFWNHTPLFAGVAQFFYTPGPPNEARHSTTLRYVADNWRNNTGVSPILLSCANKGRWAQPFSEIDSRGTAYIGGVNGPWPDGRMLSHRRAGLNAVFVDGSCRWVPCTEPYFVKDGAGNAIGEGFLLTTHYFLGSLHRWARSGATIQNP